MAHHDHSGLITIMILVLFCLLPLGWICLVYPAEQHYMVAGEPIRDAAEAVGIQVISAEAISWPMEGALGGTTYVLADDSGNTLTLRTQRFESAEARDAAIRIIGAQSVGKGKMARTLFVVGDQVILVGPDPGGILNRIRDQVSDKQFSA